MRDTQFYGAVLDIAAPLHGKAKDELAGEDVIQHKRFRHVAWLVGWLLLFLLIAASVAAYIAFQQRNRAQEQAHIALSRQLGAQAREQFSEHLDVALLLGIESTRVANTFDGRKSLISGLWYNPALSMFLHGHSDLVWSVAWSPDGKTLASGSVDRTIILWEASSGRQLRTLAGHNDGVRSVAWSPDGKTLASGSRDKTIILWEIDVDVASWQKRACRIANRNLTRAEWAQYIGDIEPYRATCPELPIEEEALKN